jgi:predicted ATPase
MTANIMRFTRLKLTNWRNFKHVDVALPQRVFVMGPNAAGKSNLLDAFRFLRDVAQDQGGLKFAVDQERGGFSAIRSLHATKNPDIKIEVHVGTDDTPDEWQYCLELGAKRGVVHVKSERVLHRGKKLFSRPDDGDKRDPKRLSQTHIEQVNQNESFRDLAEFLSSVTYVHLVPQILRDPRRYNPTPHDPFGGHFLEQIASTPKKKQQARLRRLSRALKIALPQFDDLQFERDEIGHPHLRMKYKHWRSEGTWQREDRFSDGTLRLLGLLWVIADGKAPLLLEEPELSLHAEVVRQIPRIMAKAALDDNRQILASTNSEHLVDDEGIDPDEVLVLTPSGHETLVDAASSDPGLVAAAQAGQHLGSYLVAKTRPSHVEQLGLEWNR